MPSWNELLEEIERQPTDIAKSQWLNSNLSKNLDDISKLRGDRNVMFYASAFLQKPGAPGAFLPLTYEEINGFVSFPFKQTVQNWTRPLSEASA